MFLLLSTIDYSLRRVLTLGIDPNHLKGISSCSHVFAALLFKNKQTILVEVAITVVLLQN